MINTDFQTSVLLAITGAHLNPEQVSSSLEIEPSDSWIAGEPQIFPWTKVPRGINKSGGWKLFMDDELDELSLGEQLEYFCDLLKDKSSKLKALKKAGFVIDLNCCVCTEDLATFHLAPKLIRKLSDLSVDLSLDCSLAFSDRQSNASTPRPKGLKTKSVEDADASHQYELLYTSSVKLIKLFDEHVGLLTPVNPGVLKLRKWATGDDVISADGTVNQAACSGMEIELLANLEEPDLVQQLENWTEALLDNAALGKLVPKLLNGSDSLFLNCNVISNSSPCFYLDSCLIEKLANIKIGIVLNLASELGEAWITDSALAQKGEG